MASIVYNAGVRFVATGAIDLDTDTFYMSLHTATYAPDKDAHDYANDLTDEVAGTGYTAGGKAIVATVGAVDAANDRVDVTFAPVTWPTATITNARYGVIRKRRGGALSADELLACIDFGANVSSTAADFVVTPSSPLRFQN